MASKKTKKVSRQMALSGWQLVAFVTVFAALGTYAIWKTFAAPPAAGPSSITLNQTDTYLGSRVTFTTTLPKLSGNTTPRIQVRCFQDGNSDGKIDTSLTSRAVQSGGDLVFATAGHPSDTFLLGEAWSHWVERGGPATCNAQLFYFSYKGGQQLATQLATTPDWLAGAAR